MRAKMRAPERIRLYLQAIISSIILKYRLKAQAMHKAHALCKRLYGEDALITHRALLAARLADLRADMWEAMESKHE